MTVETEVSSIRYTGIIDGVALAAPFPVQSEDDITVYYGADLVATLGVHYSVALTPPDYLTADVTPIVGFAALSDGIVSINRVVEYVNTANIPTRETLASSRLEQMVDRGVFMAQQLRDQLSRVLRYPMADPTDSLGQVPPKATRASKYFAWDVNGNPIAATVVVAGALAVSGFGAAWITLANVASALTTLGFTTVGAIGKLVVAATTKADARNEIDAIAAADNIPFLGANSFTGTSEFIGAVTVPAPTVDHNPATKKYVDDEIASGGGAAINQNSQGPTYQRVTATGNYTTPAGCKWIKVRFVGGGGGGGGGAVAGSAGSATTFNAIAAAGGTGGAAVATNASAGGAGGTGGAGAGKSYRGETGGTGGADGATKTFMMGGNGGNTTFGPGAAGGLTNSGAAAVANTGAGGGGSSGSISSSGDSAASGGGGAGEEREIYILNPTTPYAVVIGAGGAGGPAVGVYAYTGGAGGSGCVEVEEHYNY